jgi:hypothetical protein
MFPPYGSLSNGQRQLLQKDWRCTLLILGFANLPDNQTTSMQEVSSLVGDHNLFQIAVNLLPVLFFCLLEAFVTGLFYY